MALNARQEMFANEYIIDLNATQAAIRAGYSEKTSYSIGQRLLKHVEVVARVKELKDKRAEKLELDAFWVLERLKSISDRSMQAEPVLEWDPGEKAMIESGEYQFDSQGANRATELIGKHIGMFDPKLQLQLKLLEAQIEKMKRDGSIEQTTEDKLSKLFDTIEGAYRVSE
jgi:phage terminase small subunit